MVNSIYIYEPSFAVSVSPPKHAQTIKISLYDMSRIRRQREALYPLFSYFHADAILLVEHRLLGPVADFKTRILDFTVPGR